MRKVFRWTACTLLVCGLMACGGDGGEDDAATPPPERPPATDMPALTLAPDAPVCDWMKAHITPVTEPLGLTYPERRAVAWAKKPLANERGETRFGVSLNPFVAEVYDRQSRELRLGVSAAHLIAQEAACTYGIQAFEVRPGELKFEAYMPDDTARSLITAAYVSSVVQGETPDPCSGGQFPTQPPRPGCPAPTPQQ